MSTGVDFTSPGAQSLAKNLLSKSRMRAYFLGRLPLAAFAGLKIERLDGELCETLVPFGWRTQNPFGSIYFAALSMAAELSCAGLALSAARGAPVPVSVLPVHLEGSFEKKATGDTRFTCRDGAALYETVNRALASGEGETVRTTTVGAMKDGTVVSRFTFDWSFKKKA